MEESVNFISVVFTSSNTWLGEYNCQRLATSIENSSEYFPSPVFLLSTDQLLTAEESWAFAPDDKNKKRKRAVNGWMNLNMIYRMAMLNGTFLGGKHFLSSQV